MPSRRRRKRTSENGELFQIVQGEDILVEKKLPSEGAALSIAQNLASARARKGPSEDPIDYIVRLKPVLGPPDDLYIVRVTCVGAVLTAPAHALRS